MSTSERPYLKDDLKREIEKQQRETRACQPVKNPEQNWNNQMDILTLNAEVHLATAQP